MSKRVIGKIAPVSKSMPVSDSSKLLYGEVMGPHQIILQTTQQAAAQAQQMAGLRMAAMDGVDTTEGWKLNVEQMRWVKE